MLARSDWGRLSSLSGRWDEGEVAASLHWTVRHPTTAVQENGTMGTKAKPSGVGSADGFAIAPTAPKDEARRIAVRFAKLSDLLAALPRLIVNNMARGVYLVGSKLAQRVRAVQIVDCAGNSTTIRLKDYISQKIEPEYKTLPWQQDVAVLLSTNEKPKK